MGLYSGDTFYDTVTK